ncbi:MAG: HAD hydrolase family protein [Atopobiaceae bacterium]|jgi:hydroxymethylpyrimidine pyrophosphatase-like HAD family hydrolase|nr:HAD hydrolase family protein [Atopobiaceae bacterium]
MSQPRRSDQDGPHIRLVAWDMDGTILRPVHAAPSETALFAHALGERSILFVPVSSLRLDDARNASGEGFDFCSLVAASGAQIAEGLSTLKTCVIPRDDVIRLVDAVRSLENAVCIVSPATGPHLVLGKTPGDESLEEFDRTTGGAFANRHVVDSLPEGFEAVAACVAHSGHSPREVVSYLEPVSASLAFVPNGEHLIGVSLKGMDEGMGLAWLMERNGVSPEEAMAFGGTAAGASISDTVSYMVATADAAPEVQERASFSIGPSEGHSVQLALGEMINVIDREGALTPRGMLAALEIAGWNGRTRPRKS